MQILTRQLLTRQILTSNNLNIQKIRITLFQINSLKQALPNIFNVQASISSDIDNFQKKINK